MESRAKFLGHPIHQMLVAFPIGLLLTSVVFDTLSFQFEAPSMVAASYWMLTAGIVGGLVAAPFGVIDLMAIPERTRASRIGISHAVGNVVVLSLFAASWVLRPSDAPPPMGAIAFSMVGGALILLTAWMGGELVSRLGIGVAPNAHADASSSLPGTGTDAVQRTNEPAVVVERSPT